MLFLCNCDKVNILSVHPITNLLPLEIESIENGLVWQ